MPPLKRLSTGGDIKRPCYQSATRSGLIQSCTPAAQPSRVQGKDDLGKFIVDTEEQFLMSFGSDCVEHDRLLEASSTKPRSRPHNEISATRSVENGNLISSATIMYCFGMIIGDVALFPLSKSTSNLLFHVGSKVLLQLRFRSDGVSVLLPTVKEEIGILDLKTANCLTALMTIDQKITFEPYFNWIDGHDWKPQASRFFPININTYGNATKLNQTSNSLSMACIYLQVPLSYNRNFTYYNPQVLSWSTGSTPAFLSAANDSTPDFSNEIDMIFNQSAAVNVSADFTQPPSISTTLLP